MLSEEEPKGGEASAHPGSGVLGLQGTCVETLWETRARLASRPEVTSLLNVAGRGCVHKLCSETEPRHWPATSGQRIT